MNKIEVNVNNHSQSHKIHPDVAKEIFLAILQRFGFKSCCLGLTLVSESEIRELNREYRDKDSSTDVLAFPQICWERALSSDDIDDLENLCQKGDIHPDLPVILGDIVISPQNAEANAREINQTVGRELCFLMVHGLLHLLGHDHIEAGEAEQMEMAQKDLMNFLAEACAGPVWEKLVSEASSN